MTTYQLKDSAIDDLRDENPSPRRWYYGCGPGRLAVDANGSPVALVYDEPEFGAPEMTEAELFASAGPGGKVVEGMASCWEFCCESSPRLRLNSPR